MAPPPGARRDVEPILLVLARSDRVQKVIVSSERHSKFRKSYTDYFGLGDTTIYNNFHSDTCPIALLDCVRNDVLRNISRALIDNKLLEPIFLCIGEY